MEAPSDNGYVSELFEYCVYTMRHQQELERVAHEGGAGSFTEGHAWVTGSDLFGQAQVAGQRMPVLFSGADDWTGLIYWAVLTDVAVERGDRVLGVKPSTVFSFADLQRIDPARKLSDLRLRASGKPMADRDIYPYRICLTPSFL